MANTRNTAVEEKIKNAEKIIQSYAYGAELDQAIRYLKRHDSDNAVLATIKDFEDNRPMLKVLNALYRADEARANNDTAELQKIAEFLNSYKGYGNRAELQAEAMKIISELPEVKEQPEQIEAIQAMQNDTDRLNHIQERQEEVRHQTPSMSDDEIVANAQKIDSILNSDEFRNMCANAINDAGRRVTIVNDEGFTVENEDEIWLTKMRAVLNDVSTVRMDDAEFATQNEDDQKGRLKEDVITNFNLDLWQMAGASADQKNAEKAQRDFMDGKNVKINANVFHTSIETTKDRMEVKAEKLREAGKENSGNWLSRKWQLFSNFVADHCGKTPAEYGKDLIGYFSTARGITNGVASVGLIGATVVSIPAALGAAAAYGIYQSFAPSKWTIYEKKHANYKAAKASGNQQEIAKWKGWNGIRNAYKAIMANQKEKERFEKQRKVNMVAGWGSALAVTIAAPFAVGALATATAARGVASTIRVAGALTNGGIQYKDARQQYKEDQTIESKKGMQVAGTSLVLTALMSGAAEYMMAHNIYDLHAADNAMGVDHNPEHFASLDNENTQETSPVENNDNEVIEPVDVTHVAWKAGMSQNHINYVLEHVQEKAAGYAKMFGWNVNPDDNEAVIQKMADNWQKGVENGALPSDIPVGEGLYKYLHIIAWREKGEFVSDKLIQSVMVNGEPDYWTNADEIKALNHIIFCEEKPGVSVAAIGNVLNRITESGDDLDKSLDHLTYNRYVGTADLMHKAGDVNCAHVSYWERIKMAVKNVVKPEPVPEPVPEPAPEPAPAEPVPTVKPDGHAHDGATIYTVGQDYTTSSDAGSNEINGKSIQYIKEGKRSIIPGSAVDAGAEKTSSAATGNGEQALNATIIKNMKSNGMV